MFNRIAAYFLSIVLLVACSSQPQQATQPATNTPTLIPTLTPSPTSTITPTSIPTLTPTPTPLPLAGPVTENGMTRLGKGWVNDLTFSPNGKILSVATSIGVYLYQVETMQLISFLPSNAFVNDVVFIDDKTLVTGASNGATTVWDIEGAPKALETLQRTDRVAALGVTEEKAILITEVNGPSSSVIKWDRTNPENVYSVTPMKTTTTISKTIPTICRTMRCALALSQNGDILAWAKGTGDKAQIVLLDTTNQKEIAKFKNPDPGTSSLIFSSDSKLLASISFTELNLWNVETTELINTFDGALSVFFSPDGTLLASTSQDGDLILRELPSGNVRSTIKGFTPISQVVFQNGYMVSTIGHLDGYSFKLRDYYDVYKNTIVLRDISTGEIIRTFSLSDQNPKVNLVRYYGGASFTFSPDGKLFASAGSIVKNKKEQGTIFLLDGNTGKLLKSLNGFDPIAFSPDSSMLASGATRDNILVIWDIASGETLPLSLGLVPIGWSKPYQKSLVFSPDGSMITILSDKVILRDISTGKRIKTIESGLDPSLRSPSFSPMGVFSSDGNILASTWLIATSNNKLRREPKGVIILWDILSGEKIATLDGHSNPVLGKYSNSITALAFSPNGTLLASGAEDNTIIVWDAKNGSQLKVLKGHSGAINSLAFSPDSTLLYSGSLDGTVITWNIKQLLP